MLSALADYHVHTPLCRHAKGWPVEFAAWAVELGLGELGFADHNPMPEKFDNWRMLREDLPRYFEEIEKARAAFPQLTIRLGLECDFLPGRESWIEELRGMAEWDYFIGSVHYLQDGIEVDSPQSIRRYANGETEAIWAAYWPTLERAIRSGLFDFIAHPDLPKKFGFVPPGDLRRFYEPVIVALAETRTPFEINTAGWRKECAEQYPARQFLELAHAAQAPLLINSDAHAPEELAAGFDQAVALAKDVGFTQTVRLQKRAISFVALP
jgi:histidinol-phosphatase (PHP family)